MRNTFVTLIVAGAAFSLAIGGCTKEEPVTTCRRNNAGTITGTVYYTNYYTNNRHPLPNATIYLRGNTLLPSTQADANGNFVFYGLDTCMAYTVSAHQFITSPSPFSLPYYADTTFRIMMGGAGIVLNETIWDEPHDGIAYRGLSITTTDEGLGPIGNVSVYLYNSDSLARVDTNMTGGGVGTYTRIVTDSNGRWLLVFPANEPNDTALYANASFSDSANNGFRLHDYKIPLGSGFTRAKLKLVRR